MRDHRNDNGLVLLLAGACALLAAGCECGDGSDGGGERDGGDPPGDAATGIPGCIDYAPTEAGEAANGVWAEAGDSIALGTITAPADPGGGYVLLSASTEEAEAVPRLIVQVEGDAGGSVVTASDLGDASPNDIEVVFEVAPGVTYELELGQASSASAAAYPVDFDWSWTFRSVVDCYEPNDTPEEAREILLDTDVEAWAVAGFVRNGQNNGDYDDYYALTLDEAGVLEVTLSQPPGEHGMGLRVLEAGSMRQEASALQPERGQAFSAATDDPVAPGTYLIHVRTVTAADGAAKVESFPAHLETPYVLRATLR